MRKTKALTTKLKSQAGVSMAVALAFFLLCVMVGCVVLTAASVNIGKVESDRRAHQQYLAVSSAARLLKERLTAEKIKITTVTTKTITTTVTPGVNPQTQVKEEEKTESSIVPVSEDPLLSGVTAFPAEKELSVTAPDMPEVRGTISVEADYTLTVVLMDDKNGNVLTLVFPAILDDPEVEVKTDKSGTESGSMETKVTVTTTSEQNISWGTPTITGEIPEATGGST